MDAYIIKLQEKMQKKLDHYRYEHTLGVMYTAGALAMNYGLDLNMALTAGLLHDCAKCYSDEKKFELCEKYGVELTDFEKKNTALIHAKLGAVLAKEKYHVENPEICHAISCHTTGEPAMNLLDRIVFISDYIEPHRDKARRLGDIRQMAFKDTEKAVSMILEDTLNYLNGSPKTIDPMTQKTYDYYMKQK